MTERPGSSRLISRDPLLAHDVEQARRLNPTEKLVQALETAWARTLATAGDRFATLPA
jgi:hypothetical protein